MPDNDKTPTVCPDCGNSAIVRSHHTGDFTAPECDFWLCTECGHQWGHE